MERVTILFLSIFFAGTLSAQLYVQEKQPQPCGIDHRLDNRYQNPIEKIDLKNTTWRGNIMSETSSFSLLYESFEDRWGTFISFDENNFQSSYSAQCGNDCFTSTIGTYKILEDNKVEFFIEKITRRGFCSEETEIIYESIGVFQMTQSENGIQFTRI